MSQIFGMNEEQIPGRANIVNRAIGVLMNSEEEVGALTYAELVTKTARTKIAMEFWETFGLSKVRVTIKIVPETKLRILNQ